MRLFNILSSVERQLWQQTTLQTSVAHQARSEDYYKAFYKQIKSDLSPGESTTAVFILWQSLRIIESWWTSL